jgi:hypothetical protein
LKDGVPILVSACVRIRQHWIEHEPRMRSGLRQDGKLWSEPEQRLRTELSERGTTAPFT